MYLGFLQQDIVSILYPYSALYILFMSVIL